MEQEHITNKQEEGISSGYPSIDEKIGCFRNSELIVIGSRPSGGKTAFAMDIALNEVSNNQPVAFYSLGLNAIDLVRRIVVMETAKDPDFPYSESDWALFAEKIEPLIHKPLYIADPKSLMIEDLASEAKKLVTEKGVRLIIIDYLQLMMTKEAHKGVREKDLTYILQSIKDLSRQLDIPIIVLSQMSSPVDSANEVSKKSTGRENHENLVIQDIADMFIFIDSPSGRILVKNPVDDFIAVPMVFKKESLSFVEPNYIQ